ncbi:uncharacterized protein PHACADRAFT_191395 [Phanerochaete carnosa HHB-10118-sp]|uniref:BTB domain-containing protein n=1 Tax=Phanerochaete carnosa (strain HHB-10118-sp) TaxID=650164 RepID=K5WIY9_PHACS|nr:uncharacterized protein PHACADRAFT_191395 [Phanerochaete carnosa HHB-10118-sp]EKM59089.1 hypothetical protein PHACADRAFT_191395 [Phanerochaete carnosa HHB-10118-sp]
MSSPTSPTSESAGPFQTTETGSSVPFIDRDSSNETKHPRYYFDDGSIVVLAGRFKYRLHQYLFSRDSPYFANVFAHCMPSEPLNLADKKSSDFDAFLSVLYSTCYRPPDITSVDEWSAVLRLATEWSFDGICNLAIERLELIASPIEKIILSHSHSIPNWLPAAYVSLCRRPHPLTAAEIRAIEAEDVEVVMSVRETMLRAGLPLEVSEIIALIAKSIKSATNAATLTPPDPIPEVTNMAAFPRSNPIPATTKADASPRADSVPPSNPIPEVKDTAEVTLAEPGTEAAKVQKLYFEIHRRFDSASLLLLASADSTQNIASRTLAHVLSSVVQTEVVPLLEKLTPDNIDPIAREIAQWIDLTTRYNNSVTLQQIIDLVYDKATSDRASARVCSLLCQQLTGEIPANFQRPGDRDYEGGARFRDCLLDKCLREAKSTRLKMGTATQGSEELSAIELSSCDDEDALSVAHECEYAAVHFIGELLVVGVLAIDDPFRCLDNIVPEYCTESPSDEEARLVCAFLLTVGPCLPRANYDICKRMNRYLCFVKKVGAEGHSAQTAALVEKFSRMQRDSDVWPATP